MGSSTAPRYPLPDYLYNDKLSDDASYLLNMDIFYHHTVNNILGTLQGQIAPAERRGDMLQGTYSKDVLLQNYSRPPHAENITTFSDYKNSVDANLQRNIIPLIEANPNTNFTFFFVPFSILYWDTDLRQGDFDAVMDATLYTIQTLLEYENVEVFFFQNRWDIATNLDNYKDYSHYGPWINSYMTQAIANGDGKLTLDTCEETINTMRSFVHNYDFDSIFADS